MSKLQLGGLMFMIFMLGVVSTKLYTHDVVNKRFDFLFDLCTSTPKRIVQYKSVSYKNIYCASLSEIHEISLQL